MANPSLADLRTLCEANACTPALRIETRDGRLWASISATEAKTGGKTLYDNRADVSWDEGVGLVTLIATAIATWFK